MVTNEALYVVGAEEPPDQKLNGLVEWIVREKAENKEELVSRER